MALADNGPAPYAPVKAVLTMIGLFRDKTLPLPISTASIERAGVEESLARRTFAAMKLLDLLDEDGNPTPTMEKIRVAGADTYKDVLAEWLREAYKPVFLYVEPTDDVQKISDQFRHYDPKGQRNRMVTLFLGLCTEAGIIDKVPALPRTNARNTTAAGSSAGRVGPRKIAEHKPPQEKPKPKDQDRHPVALDEARAEYVALLMSKASAQDGLDADLLDRIERALGIAPTKQGADP